MTNERRANPRTQCRIPCEIESSSDRAGGTVLDVSEGGLSVQTTIEAELGRCVPHGTCVGQIFGPCSVGKFLIPLHSSDETNGFESRNC
jgi:hypothetical protein